ncbi:dehydrin DHN1-like [Rosa rugosa]|uniref:dehydrin DHN1-like n=1 Tax=Rosa rugosa TaxID=74645 RepID=UPI002B40BADB|nr:dehydrin DHN1-like [Rosa rugosa]
MAHYQSEYSRDKTTDEFGNPICGTEDPVHHGVTEATGGYGTHDTRSNKSEDDGYGGRRKKKGLKENIRRSCQAATVTIAAQLIRHRLIPEPMRRRA